MTGFESFSEIISIAEAEAEKSNDAHTHVGAVLLNRGLSRKFNIISRGHNLIIHHGDPASFERPLKYDRVIHAEVMAIGAAMQLGIATRGGILVITHPPCIACSTLIRASGVSTVVIGRGQYVSDTPETRRASEFILRGAVNVIPMDEVPYRFDP